jgi:cation:H+ antiporter
MWLDLLVVTTAALLSTVLVWRACERLERAAHRLALQYGMPEIVKGSLLMAVSSSVPELATVVISTVAHGNFELGFAALLGSAIFNVLVIPAASVSVAPEGLRTSRAIVFQEVQFYLVGVLAFFLTLCLAVIYSSGPDRVSNVVLTRELALLPIAFYGLYLFFQYHEVRDHEPFRDNSAQIDARREWLALVFSVALVAVGVEVLVRCALRLGVLFDTPSYFWGLTLIAVATSVPDLFLSLRAAQQNQPAASLSNVFGSNDFDLLVVIPVGVLIAGDAIVDFNRTLPIMAALTGATVILAVLMRSRFRLRGREATLLATLYVLFLLWRTLESFGAGSSGGG